MLQGVSGSFRGFPKYQGVSGAFQAVSKRFKDDPGDYRGVLEDFQGIAGGSMGHHGAVKEVSKDSDKLFLGFWNVSGLFQGAFVGVRGFQKVLKRHEM